MHTVTREIFTFISYPHNMPRATGLNKRTARWNKSDDAKFLDLVVRGKINIVDVTPATIDYIRAKYSWVNRSETNFRQRYKRVANTLQLTQDLDGARAQRRKGESYHI
jgi:hypothetical protein